MSIPKSVKVKNSRLPAKPGVYLFRDQKGRVVYVGKATNLKARIGSYFNLSFPRNLSPSGIGERESSNRLDPQSRSGMTYGGRPIEEMLHEVKRIDYVVTDSVIEALILEANLIKKYQPRYNVRDKDDKSFLYVVVTKEKWPKVMLMRGSELGRSSTSSGNKTFYLLSGAQRSRSAYSKVFGPCTSASAIRAALDLIRKWFPWSTCHGTWNMKHGAKSSLRSTSYPLRTRACFDYHIGRCPGVCIGAISRRDYMQNIRSVILFLEGKKIRVLKNLGREMKRAAKAERFEEAEKLRRKIFALQHIRDIAVLTKDNTNAKPYTLTPSPSINILGRIEGYDISNISGTSAVGSMVVFQNGEPSKSEYRRFRIKTVQGINDVAMMKEVLLRRFKDLNIKSWGVPDLIVIDGGWGQVNAAREVIDDMRRTVLRPRRRPSLPDIPVVGIAKGFKRKQDRPVFDKDNPELARIVENYKDLLLRVRDEAHRFAVVYHRKRMRKRLSP